MNVDSVLIIGPAASFPTVLGSALKEAFPQAVPTTAPDLSAVGGPRSGTGLEILLLAAPEEPEETPAAEAALDPENLPRWGVLRFGGHVPAIAPAGWTVDQLVCLLHGVAARHALSRDNARLRGELLTIARRVSHDLRTPLGGIIATVDMLAETIPSVSTSTKPVFSSVDEITKIITRTSFLLKAIAQPLPRKSLAMAVPVQEALLRLERPIHQKQATVHQPASWPTVEGVAPWLELIWWNLIHNALQHTGPAPVITLGWEKETGAHRFRISDSGPGVPLNSPGKLFNPFHLLHDPEASHGLGLPIVRRLTELQGGQCGYRPEPQGGSIFHFTLPDS